MTTVLRVDLGKTEDLRVCERTTQFVLYLVQISNLFFRESETFLLVVFLEVCHVLDGFGLYVYIEDGLIEPVIHALQHGVVLCLSRCHGEVFLYTQNAAEIHILCNLYGICAPRCYHLATRTHEEALHLCAIHKRSLAIKPAKLADFVGCQLMITLRCDYALLGSFKEKYHCYRVVNLLPYHKKLRPTSTDAPFQFAKIVKVERRTKFI